MPHPSEFGVARMSQAVHEHIHGPIDNNNSVRKGVVMATAIAVIGAAWGDEGKGLMVDYFARSGGVVARFNGGAQAGHTVQRPDGRRHVFHHVGSGALRGAATFLTRYFVHNPLLLPRELDELAGLGVSDPTILADPDGQVTTPWDMMLNQCAEEARGVSRHGSCGVGFNETIRRGLDSPWTIRVGDLANANGLRRTALAIRSEWVPARLASLGLDLSEEWRRRFVAPGVADAFVAAAARFRGRVAIDDGATAVDAARDDALVFEGAQGLLLDQDHRFFPHVTHSKTGLPNAMALASEWGLDGVTAVYVTRAYATRHGPGPFPREVAGLSYPDPTNVPNVWQGALRFGEVDLDLLAATIEADVAGARIPVDRRLAVTCLDQVGSASNWWRGGRRASGTPHEFLCAAMEAAGCKLGFVSVGPCREAVTAFDPDRVAVAARSEFPSVEKHKLLTKNDNPFLDMRRIRGRESDRPKILSSGGCRPRPNSGLFEIGFPFGYLITPSNAAV
jgi:adenylosuccinate synthase